MPRGDQENSKIWRRLIKWGKDHCLGEAREADWKELLLKRAQSHPLPVRLVWYGKHWAREQSRSAARSYPSFREWRRAADRYVIDQRVDWLHRFARANIVVYCPSASQASICDQRKRRNSPARRTGIGRLLRRRVSSQTVEGLSCRRSATW